MLDNSSRLYYFISCCGVWPEPGKDANNERAGNNQTAKFLQRKQDDGKIYWHQEMMPT